MSTSMEIGIALESGVDDIKPPRPHWGEPGSKVTRKTAGFVFSSGKGRHVIVTLYHDGGLIGLRLSKHRREEYVYASDIYRMAVVSRVSAERAAKKKARK